VRFLHTLFCTGVLVLLTTCEASASYYVATNGNDAWSGQLPEPNAVGADGPLASLGRARDLIRATKSAGGLKQPITVFVRGGRYALAEPLVLTPEDSGTAQCPIPTGRDGDNYGGTGARCDRADVHCRPELAGICLAERRMKCLHLGEL
jgi:hypothetical protein